VDEGKGRIWGKREMTEEHVGKTDLARSSTQAEQRREEREGRGERGEQGGEQRESRGRAVVYCKRGVR